MLIDDDDDGDDDDDNDDDHDDDDAVNDDDDDVNRLQCRYLLVTMSSGTTSPPTNIDSLCLIGLINPLGPGIICSIHGKQDIRTLYQLIQNLLLILLM